MNKYKSPTKQYIKICKTVCTEIQNIYIPLTALYGRRNNTYFYVLPTDLKTKGGIYVYIFNQAHNKFVKKYLTYDNKITVQIQEYYVQNKSEIDYISKVYQPIKHKKQQQIDKQDFYALNKCAYKQAIGCYNPPNNRI